MRVNESISFGEAIEILEIVDISKIKITDLSKLEKKAQKRWHPDRVSHQRDNSIIEEYTENFKKIKLAIEIIKSFLNGDYKSNAFKNDFETKTSENIIKENGIEIQEKIKVFWTKVKKEKYKWELKEIIMSDGFVLRDLLKEDFKDDISSMSIISLIYGTMLLILLTIFGEIIYSGTATFIGLIIIVHILSCCLSFLPLSRFWLPETVVNFILWFVNFGLKIYNKIDEITVNSNMFLQFFVIFPELLAKVIKYVFLFPLYELGKLLIGSKVVGVVKEEVNYYADVAEWYIDELINKNINEMTTEELYHLSYIYTELKNVDSV